MPIFDFLGQADAAKQSFITAWNAIVHFEYDVSGHPCNKIMSGFGDLEANWSSL
ncbi:MAG TPA: hypothetical protein VI522_00375 [Gammaproteobacteria bacterium]|nr:hypothetical protein [Gammaproteobacteria bacterium]